MKNSLRISILTRDNYTCQYCGRRPPQVQLHVEHIISRYDGGSDHPSNLAASCTDCNYGKSRRSLHITELEPKDPLFFMDFQVGPLPKSVPCVEPSVPVIPDATAIADALIHQEQILKALDRCHWNSIRQEWKGEPWEVANDYDPSRYTLTQEGWKSEEEILECR